MGGACLGGNKRVKLRFSPHSPIVTVLFRSSEKQNQFNRCARGLLGSTLWGMKWRASGSRQESLRSQCRSDTCERREGGRGLGGQSLRLWCSVEKALVGLMGNSRAKTGFWRSPHWEERPSSASPSALFVWEQPGTAAGGSLPTTLYPGGNLKGTAPWPPQTLTK